MTLPLLDYELIHHAPLNDAKMWLESFRYNSTNYAGIQPSAWEASERSWDADNYGAWRGPGAVHVRPGSLNVAALDESVIALEDAGADQLARVTDTPIEGALLRASWTHLNPGSAALLSGTTHLILQDAETGDVLDEQTLDYFADHADLPALTAHAVLWVRFEQVTRGWSLPPDYLSVRGFSSVPDKYKYTEGGTEYVWDYEADVGRRPTDLNHAFYALHEAAFLSGTLLHRGAWTQYISDGGAEGGPWSALRIAVGEDDFVVGENFQPAPGPVLYELTGEETRLPVLIDPLALSVCAVPEQTPLRFGTNAGKCRLGGTLAGRSGPFTAYWDFHPAAPIDNLCATLLGVSALNFVNVCEASLYPVVSDILEIAPDEAKGETVSRELVLSHSHLYEYAPDGPSIPFRLPGLPRATLGHPGGRCLRYAATEYEVRFLTEYFGGMFYNTLRTLSANQSNRLQVGTAFHGNNCAEMCWGDYWGWVQDGAFASSTARQYLAFIRQGGISNNTGENDSASHLWDKSAMPSFPASSHRWQRLRALSTKTRTVLVSCGMRPATGEAIWGIADGVSFTEYELPFRPRRLTRCVDEDGIEWIYAIGRFMEEDEESGEWSFASRWSIIRLRGNSVTVRACFDEGAFCMDKSDAEALGLDVDALPPFLRWIPVGGIPAGGYWKATDEEPDEPFLTLDVGVDSICFLLNGVLPYDVTYWPCIEFEVGNTTEPPIIPKTDCEDAGCVIDKDPEGIAALIVFKRIQGPWWASAQVCDVNDVEEESGLRILQKQCEAWPNLWGRIDSDAAFDDLSSYDIPLTWDNFLSLPGEVRKHFDVCVLAAVGSGPLLAPALVKRNDGSGVTLVRADLPGPSNSLLLEGEGGFLLLTEAGEVLVTEQE